MGQKTLLTINIGSSTYSKTGGAERLSYAIMRRTVGKARMARDRAGTLICHPDLPIYRVIVDDVAAIKEVRNILEENGVRIVREDLLKEQVGAC